MTKEKEMTIVHRPCGKLTLDATGHRLPLLVIECGRGYYLGTADEDGPVARESMETWTTATEAEAAIESGEWTQADGEIMSIGFGM